jgi:hypothetical protein
MLSSLSQGAGTLSDLRMNPIDHAPPPPPATPPSLVQSTQALSDLTTAQPSALTAPQVLHTGTKRPITPSCVLPAKMKRPRNLAYPLAHPQAPQQKNIGRPVVGTNLSKQAVSKNKANECVLNGTFVHNPKRWEGYKKKLAELDPNFEVSEDPRLVRKVKHSVCGGWFVMAAPYDKERFKKHITSCSYSSGCGGMKSLERFGVRVLSTSTLSSSLPSSSSSPSPASSTTSLLPCPGLTQKDDASISQYLSRTSVASAGGEDLLSVARSLFSDEFKNLSLERKELVRLKQKHTHTWSVHHLMKTIHAIGKAPCEENADMASDGSVRACKACRALLSSRLFRNAISRKPAPNQNRAYIPHIYQPAVIGKIYTLGFHDLIDGVSARFDFQACRPLISTLDIQSQRDLDQIRASSGCREPRRSTSVPRSRPGPHYSGRAAPPWEWTPKHEVSTGIG